MPYFERKPWQDAADTALSTASKKTPEDFDFATAARSVLSNEASRKQGDRGPFRCRTVVSPGHQGVIVLSIAANGAGGPMTLNFSSDGLRTHSGREILSRNIKIIPDQIIVEPDARQVVEVRVDVPDQAKPGVFVGNVVGDGPEPMEFAVEFEVNSIA